VRCLRRCCIAGGTCGFVFPPQDSLEVDGGDQNRVLLGRSTVLVRTVIAGQSSRFWHAMVAAGGGLLASVTGIIISEWSLLRGSWA
jgi:hypothetical protein